MSETTIQIDGRSAVPVYRQVVDQVRVHLDSGALVAGDVLPSVRSLAAQLGVNFNTVAEAYRELALEGWVDLQHGKRAVVCQRAGGPTQDPAEAEGLMRRLRQLVAEMRLKGVSPHVIEREVQLILRG